MTGAGAMPPVPENQLDDTQRRCGESSRLALWLLAIIAMVLIVAALRATAWISGTLAFAFFAALALQPVQSWIGARVPRAMGWLGHLAALLTMLLIFVLFTAGLLFVVQQLAAGIVRYREPLERLAARISARIDIAAGQPSGDGTAPLAERLIDPVMSLATGVAQSMWSFGGVLTLLFFLVWLMLLEAPSYSAKLSGIASRRDGAALHDIVDATASRFRSYLLMRALLGLATGLLYMAWTWWWGLDFVLVWGLLAFLLNFIPTIGSIIAGVLPVALAFLQRDPVSALIIGGGLLVIEQVMGNYVDPLLQGRQLSLSPLAVLLALAFWTWMWGLVGALLAVPMTLVLTIACAHVEALKPIALALSNATNLEELEEATAP